MTISKTFIILAAIPVLFGCSSWQKTASPRADAPKRQAASEENSFSCVGLIGGEIQNSDIAIDLNHPVAAQIKGKWFGKDAIVATLEDASSNLSPKAKALGTVQFAGQTARGGIVLTVWTLGKDGLMYSIRSSDEGGMGIGKVDEVRTRDVIQPQWICKK